MKKLELISGIIALIALTMHFFLIPGGSILLLLSSMILICLYYPLGFALFNKITLKQIFDKNSYKGISALRIIGTIGLGAGLAATWSGVLFKCLRYPGAEMNLVVGLIVNAIVLLIAVIKYNKSKDTFYTRVFKRVFIIGGFGLILVFISDLTLVKILYQNHPEYIKAYEMY